MKNVFKTSIPAALMLALPFALAPQTAQAQDIEEPQACTVEVMSGEIAAGEAAVPLMASLSESVGAVSGIEAGESGISISAPEDLPRTEMAAETDTRTPIEMADVGNSLTLWLNTTGAAPGTHEIVIQGELGQCTATVTVAEPAS